MPSQQTYCKRVWNLIHACDVQLAIRKCNLHNLLTCRGSNPGPAEPEADMLPSEPARRAYVREVMNLRVP